MTTPEDVAALAARYGEEQAAAAVLPYEQRINSLTEEVGRLQALNTEVQKKYDDHMATHAPPAPTITRGQKSVGVQVFPDRQDLSYGKDLAGTKRMLKDGAWKIVRGGIGPSLDQSVIDWYNDLYDTLGITAMFTVGKPREPLTAAQWDTIATHLGKFRPGLVTTLFSWNEPNHVRSGTNQPPLTGWRPMTIKHGYELMKRFGAKYEIGSAQLWSGNLDTSITDLKALAAETVTIDGKVVKYADTFETTVWHLYQVGTTPFNRYDTEYKALFGARPVICSETGMSTAPNQTQGALSMSEADQATHLVKQHKMYIDKGYRSVQFELRDEPDPDGTDREDWLGTNRADGTPKPAVAALRNLLLTTV